MAMIEARVQRPAVAFDEGERDRLVALLERYRELVRRAAAGESLEPRDEQVAATVLESLWLGEMCWRRDVMAWRSMEAVRSGLAAEACATGVAQDRLRYRERELEVLHPHLFCSMEAAAFLRWDLTRRALRW